MSDERLDVPASHEGGARLRPKLADGPKLADAMRAAARAFPAPDRERDARVLGAIGAEWALRRLDEQAFPAASALRDERCARRIEGALAERRERAAQGRRSRRRPAAPTAVAFRVGYATAAAIAFALATWALLHDAEQTPAPRIVAPAVPVDAHGPSEPGSDGHPGSPPGPVERATETRPHATFDRALAAASAARDLRALEALLDTNPLHPERERLARAIIELAPDHDTSREILGHVMYQGQWITRDELLALGSHGGSERAPELPPEIEFARWLATAGTDPREWWAQHEWCAAKGLVREALDCAQRVLQLDPDHEWARLSIGQIRHEGRWVSREELARIHRDQADGTSPAMLTAWAAHFGAEPLATTTAHTEIWVQKPAHTASAAELSRGLAEISRRLDLSTKEFLERNPGAMGGRQGRLRIAVFTQPDDYRGMCTVRQLAVAQDQAGLVVEDRTIALSPASVGAASPTLGRLMDAGSPRNGGEPRGAEPTGPLFYDDFLRAACEPDASPERRVLWQAALDAQERLAQPIVVSIGARFLVAAAAKDPQAQALATGAAAKLDELVARMGEDGLLLGRSLGMARPAGGGVESPDRHYAVVLTSGTEAWRDAVARRPAKLAHQPCWAGSYEPTRGLVLVETSYIEAVLHAGAWIALHHAAGRLAGDADLYWLHEGLAHYAAGRVLDPAGALHPRWSPALARLLEQGGTGIPLVQLIEAERGKLLASKAYAKREALDLAQAQSWALVHYLMRGADRATPGRLVGWWTSVAKHGGGFDSFRRHLEHSDTARLERDIHRHLRTIAK